MGRTALYRKYRSRALSEVIGQDHITSVLAAAVKGGGFSHAYIFTGPRGIGKTSVARILAHLVNDLEYDETDKVDIIEIDAASNTGVDNIRDLREKVNIAPTSTKYKVYIIDEVHMLSTGAFNALLKTLEEPPEHVIFILATTEVQKVPATILSRAQRFHFRPVGRDKVVEHLRSIAKAEKIKISDEALELIAERGEGSFRDSISLLDQLSGLGQKIELSDVEDTLGLAPNQQIEKLVAAVVGKNPTEITKILNQFKAEGISASVVAEQLINKLAMEAAERPKLYKVIEALIDAPKSADPQLKMLAILADFTSQGAAALPLRAEPMVMEEIKVEYKPVRKAAAAIDNVVNFTTEVAEKAPKTIDWEEVKAKITETNAIFGSLLGNASVDYDGETLTLYFRQKFYRNKMNGSDKKEQLGQVLENLYGGRPKIVVSEGLKPKNDNLSKVADIMGGGEVL